MIITDNEIERNRIAEEITSRLAANVCFFSNEGKELENLSGKHDLILIDEKLDTVSGFQIFQTIKNVSPEIPIVMTVGDNCEDIVKTALEKGLDNFIYKTANFQILLPNLIMATISNKKKAAEKEKLEKDLREVTNKDRAILQALPDLMFVFDKNAIFCDYHTLDKSNLFVQPDEFLGKSVFDIFPKKIAEMAFDNIRKILTTSETQTYEYELTKRDVTCYEEVRMVLYDTDKVLAIVRDITKRTLAKNDLKTSEKKFRELSSLLREMMDNTRDLVWIKDLNKKYLFANRAICKKFLNAKDTAEPIGKTELFFAERERKSHPGSNNWFTFGENSNDSDSLIMESRKPSRFEESGNIKGKFLFLEVYKTPFWDEEGEMIGIIGFGRDITKEKELEKERKQNLNELRNSEQSYRNLFTSATDAIYIHDNEGKFIDVNPGAEKMYGYKKEDFIGKTPEFLAAPEKNDLKKVAEHCKNAFKGKPQKFEFWGLRKSGEHFPKIVRLNKGTYFGKEVIIAFASDITEQKAEQQRTFNKATLLDKLRNIQSIDECLRSGCEAIHNSGLFERSVITLHDHNKKIINIGQVGLDEKIISKAIKETSPSVKLIEKLTDRKFKISHSYFIPEEAGIKFDSSGRFIPQEKILTINTKSLWQKGDVLFVPMFDKDGKPEGYLSVDTPINGKRPDKKSILYLEDIMDIVARQIHEIRNLTTLRDNEEMYRTIINTSSDAIITTDEEGKVLSWNNSSEKIFGYGAEEIIGKSFLAIIPENIKENAMKIYKHVLRSKKSSTDFKIFETTAVNMEGKIFPVEYSRSVATTSKDIIATAIIRDITKRKLSEQKLIKHSSILRVAAESSHVLLTYEQFDEALEEIFGILGKALNVGQVFIIENYTDDNTGEHFMSFTQEWTEGENSQIDNNELKHISYDLLFPRWRRNLEHNNPIYGCVDDFPKNERKFLRSLHFVSMLVVPVIVDNIFWGSLVLNDSDEGRKWEEEEISMLTTLANNIGSTISRNLSREQIRKDLDEKELLLKEKELLLKEVHHRVKNNMQIICSMLSLQSRYIKDEDDKELFLNSQNRVKSMSLIHEKLYRSDDMTSVNFKDYIRSLSALLISSYRKDHTLVTIKSESKNVFLDIGSAIPCGLIINELITNSLKYAFPDSRKGTISISLEEDADKNKILTISDDGIGMALDTNLETSETLGLQIVDALTSQLHATVRIDTKKGTKFIITFRELENGFRERNRS